MSSGLEFFNKLSGKLEVRLTEPPERISPKLENQAATPTARVVSVALQMRAVERGERVTFRPLTDDELARVVLEEGQIRMRTTLLDTSVIVDHTSSSGSFNVRELVSAIEETERRTRESSKWFGGVDVQHVFFEGIALDSDGVWEIRWGS